MNPDFRPFFRGNSSFPRARRDLVSSGVGSGLKKEKKKRFKIEIMEMERNSELQAGIVALPRLGKRLRERKKLFLI